MTARKHRTYVSRIVWLFNHSADRNAWYDAAINAGYTMDAEDRAHCSERRLSWDGTVVAHLYDFGKGEMFGYVFVCEADAPLRKRILWRLTHPLTAKQELPWPRKERIANA